MINTEIVLWAPPLRFWHGATRGLNPALSQSCHAATGTQLPYGLTQCFLPPGRDGTPALTLSKAKLILYSVTLRDARLS